MGWSSCLSLKTLVSHVLRQLRDALGLCIWSVYLFGVFKLDKSPKLAVADPRLAAFCWKYSKSKHWDLFQPYFPLYLAKYELRKQLAEILILSKLDYADLVFYLLPRFLLRRLQRVQFAATSFILGHYVKNFWDVLIIGWLSIKERRDLNLLKSCFKALHNTETWPDYLKITKQECPKELPSSNSIRLVVLTEKRHFPR